MRGITAKQKRELVMSECKRLGVSIEQQGKAYRLRSNLVDILVTDLSWVLPLDLKPWPTRSLEKVVVTDE